MKPPASFLAAYSLEGQDLEKCPVALEDFSQLDGPSSCAELSNANLQYSDKVILGHHRLSAAVHDHGELS